jgi:hypothetical protein
MPVLALGAGYIPAFGGNPNTVYGKIVSSVVICIVIILNQLDESTTRAYIPRSHYTIMPEITSSTSILKPGIPAPNSTLNSDPDQ